MKDYYLDRFVKLISRENKRWNAEKERERENDFYFGMKKISMRSSRSRWIKIDFGCTVGHEEHFSATKKGRLWKYLHAFVVYEFALLTCSDSVTIVIVRVTILCETLILY